MIILASLRLFVFATPRTDADSILLTLQQTTAAAALAVSIDDIRRGLMIILSMLLLLRGRHRRVEYVIIQLYLLGACIPLFRHK